LELRRIFDVPGRIYRLKEWDVEVGVTRAEAETPGNGSNDGAASRSETRKRYGIDFEEDES